MAKKEQNENGPRKVSFYVKLATGIICLFIAIGSIIFNMESRYAKAEVVKEQKIELTEDIKLASSDLLQTIQHDRKNADIRFYQQLIEQSHDKETDIIIDLQQNPNSNRLKDKLKQEKLKQQKYNQRLDELLSN